MSQPRTSAHTHTHAPWGQCLLHCPEGQQSACDTVLMCRCLDERCGAACPMGPDPLNGARRS